MILLVGLWTVLRGELAVRPIPVPPALRVVTEPAALAAREERLREVLEMLHRALPSRFETVEGLRLREIQIMPGAALGGVEVGALLVNTLQRPLAFPPAAIRLLDRDGNPGFRIRPEPRRFQPPLAPGKTGWITFLIDNPPDFDALRFESWAPREENGGAG